MKLEETIQKMYDFYPSLFTERWQCLNHLFCVIGNGYRWENGELIGDPYKSEEGYALQLGPGGKAELNLQRAKAYLAEYYQETADLSGLQFADAENLPAKRDASAQTVPCTNRKRAKESAGAAGSGGTERESKLLSGNAKWRTATESSYCTRPGNRA